MEILYSIHTPETQQNHKFQDTKKVYIYIYYTLELTHPPTRRSSHTSNESDDRLTRVAIIRPPLGRILLGAAADLADHDDPVRLRIVAEFHQTIDEVRPVERIAADPDARRLAQSGDGRLMHGLVRERAGTGHHPDSALRVDIPGHDPDFAFPRLDDAGTIRSDQARFVLCQ